ncbi:MAG: hypothetical protein ACLQBX_18440 [Candidatus Limnocylindrales bacterium]|jgi:hypothetical protein
MSRPQPERRRKAEREVVRGPTKRQRKRNRVGLTPRDRDLLIRVLVALVVLVIGTTTGLFAWFAETLARLYTGPALHP